MKEGPISDPDSYFTSIDVADTPAVKPALRASKIQFSVSNNPVPAGDEAGTDVFCFCRSDDHFRIQQIIREAASHMKPPARLTCSGEQRLASCLPSWPGLTSPSGIAEFGSVRPLDTDANFATFLLRHGHTFISFRRVQ